ncbi:hypothetical protein ACKLNR_009030 [Fusarium oxysporum f. sp. zingiberi]
MAPMVVVDFKGSAQVTAGMLPITTTLGNLNEKRLDPIEQIKDSLQDVHNTLLKESGLSKAIAFARRSHLVCWFICVSTTLNLVKECSEPMPLHDNPVTERLRYIDANDGRTYPCSIKGRMTPVLQKIDMELEGMRPADFKD